jgi:hypothetical protein
VNRPAPTTRARRAAVLAALALGLAPSSAVAQDPAELVEAAIPHDSAISEQYQRVQEVLDQAATAIPDTPISQPAAESEPAPPPPPPAPEPPAPKPQYHSETPSNVSVTQQQPSNVNVSIRINSPGDDGPVVQINNAGGTSVVEQVVQRPEASAPAPAAPAGGDLPDTWEWVWTSACFGGAPHAGAASAVPGWSWRWSCEEGEKPAGGHDVVPDLPGLPASGVPRADELIAAAAPTFAAVSPFAAPPERPRPERRARPAPASADTGGAGPPPAAGRPPPAPPLVAGASAHAPPPLAAHRAPPSPRATVRARPGPGGDGSSSTLPPGSGLGLGAATALSSMATFLLGIWIAVLVTACVLVLPRLRHRRWSGLTWWLTRLPSVRLERPG